MNKPIRKLAMIRSNEESSCPFGLDITHFCKTAGDKIDQLTSIESLGQEATDQEKKELTEHNKRLMLWIAPNQPCKYAAQIIESHKAVQCSFEDGTSDKPSKHALLGSEAYSKMYGGGGIGGLNTIPLSYTGSEDYNIRNNGYYGAYSLQGVLKDSEILKLSQELLDIILKNNK